MLVDRYQSFDFFLLLLRKLVIYPRRGSMSSVQHIQSNALPHLYY
jgi:hypothetical protein